MSTLHKAAQQAIEALESLFTLQMNYILLEQREDAISALRAALAQEEQKQEPVARMHADGSGRIISQATYDEAQRQGGAPWSSVRGYTTPLYTTPPRREWQRLTNEEIYPLYNEPRSDAEMLEFALAVEAALKEKNNG